MGTRRTFQANKSAGRADIRRGGVAALQSRNSRLPLATGGAGRSLARFRGGGARSWGARGLAASFGRVLAPRGLTEGMAVVRVIKNDGDLAALVVLAAGF